MTATIENHGSFYLIRPADQPAMDWLKANTDGQWIGYMLAVEPRYVGPLLEGFDSEGGTITGWHPEKGWQ